jgi:hypothetical protein
MIHEARGGYRCEHREDHDAYEQFDEREPTDAPDRAHATSTVNARPISSQ